MWLNFVLVLGHKPPAIHSSSFSQRAAKLSLKTELQHVCFPTTCTTQLTMSRPWILTSPASRGIGFALTRHLLLNTRAPVVATARRDLDSVRSSLLESCEKNGAGKEDLSGMDKRLQVSQLDVTGACSWLAMPPPVRRLLTIINIRRIFYL